MEQSLRKLGDKIGDFSLDYSNNAETSARWVIIPRGLGDNGAICAETIQGAVGMALYGYEALIDEKDSPHWVEVDEEFAETADTILATLREVERGLGGIRVGNPSSQEQFDAMEAINNLKSGQQISANDMDALSDLVSSTWTHSSGDGTQDSGNETENIAQQDMDDLAQTESGLPQSNNQVEDIAQADLDEVSRGVDQIRYGSPNTQEQFSAMETTNKADHGKTVDEGQMDALSDLVNSTWTHDPEGDGTQDSQGEVDDIIRVELGLPRTGDDVEEISQEDLDDYAESRAQDTHDNDPIEIDRSKSVDTLTKLAEGKYNRNYTEEHAAKMADDAAYWAERRAAQDEINLPVVDNDPWDYLDEPETTNSDVEDAAQVDLDVFTVSSEEDIRQVAGIMEALYPEDEVELISEADMNNDFLADHYAENTLFSEDTREDWAEEDAQAYLNDAYESDQELVDKAVKEISDQINEATGGWKPYTTKANTVTFAQLNKAFDDMLEANLKPAEPDPIHPDEWASLSPANAAYVERIKAENKAKREAIYPGTKEAHELSWEDIFASYHKIRAITEEAPDPEPFDLENYLYKMEDPNTSDLDAKQLEEERKENFMNTHCTIHLTSSTGVMQQHRVTYATYYNLLNSGNNVKMVDDPMGVTNTDCSQCEDPDWDEEVDEAYFDYLDDADSLFDGCGDDGAPCEFCDCE